MHFFFLKILFSIVAQIGMRQDIDTTLEQSMSVVSTSSQAQIRMTVPKIEYISSDTLRLEINIACMGEIPILVPDPIIFKPGYFVARNDIRISVRTTPGSGDIFPQDKLIKLKILESASYFIDIPLEFDTIGTSPDTFYIQGWLRYTPYIDELEYLTQGDSQYVRVDNTDHINYLEGYTQRPEFGDIAIIITKP